MELTGKNWIGAAQKAAGSQSFRAANPQTGASLAPDFDEASAEIADEAVAAAAAAAAAYRQVSPTERAAFLDRVAEEIVALGDDLIVRAGEETALPEARLVGERGRTVGQIKAFAELVREGSWVDACIDRAIPDRAPLPKPDLRRVRIPLGPVVVFGASNFPLAFGVAGGDTASALAAGCPVVVKAHPAHPGTCELVASAFRRAITACGMPDGVFSMVHGAGHEVGMRLVSHPDVAAVAFTGSLGGGRALYDAAAKRPVPIPVHAEMGSVNPVFVLPGALAERAEPVAEGLCQSVTLGGGQFCTNPGLVVGLAGDGLTRFEQALSAAITAAPPATMLHAGIRDGYEDGCRQLESNANVELLASSSAAPDPSAAAAAARAFATDAATFLASPELGDEVFGPSTLVVRCASEDELRAVAQSLAGHLTATVHGSRADLEAHAELVELLEIRVGRLLFGGFPTGVEVCPAMHHGGPYPATTDSRTTSVGTAAITRFARPVCYQNWPEDLLPAELRDGNERGIWRTIDGEWTREDV